MSDTNPVRVQVTFSDKESARSAGRRLVEMRFAASVQLEEIESIYRWRDEIVERIECRIEVKTISACVDAIRQVVDEMHPYELPELVVEALNGVSAAYVDWIQANTESE